jgi:23S rRNA (adenine2503-C2)-methyltransferase
MALVDLRALTPSELSARLAALGQPRFRAEQIFRWLHEHGASTWDDMTSIPRAVKDALGDELTASPLQLDVEQLARDGTRKMRFRTQDGRSIESVLIPEERERAVAQGARGEAQDVARPPAGGDGVRGGDVMIMARDKLTLCVSSQVGCALDCQFCATATLGFGRHLTVGEIVSQVYQATARAGRRPSNLVFMGMGEPLHNLDAVSRALAILIHPWGAGFSPRRITVSTAGLVPGIEKLGQLSPAPNLAVSLNATTDETRDRLMPINRKWPMAALLEAVRRFPLAHGRKITFEYVLLAGVNDSDEDANRLPRLLAGLPSMVNLIPWNPFSGPAFSRPSAERIRSFQEILRRHNLPAYIRTPRGDDIDAACGQLAARGQPEVDRGTVIDPKRLRRAGATTPTGPAPTNPSS